jgi:hypothetical protein
MKRFVQLPTKVLLATISILAVLLAAAWCFFAFTYQWVLTWQSLIIIIPLIAALIITPLLMVRFFKRQQWRFGFYGTSIALLILIYTGLILWNYSYLVVQNPKSNPTVSPDTDENRILMMIISGNVGGPIFNDNKHYTVIEPDNTNVFVTHSNSSYEETKNALITQYKKQYAPDENMIQSLEKLFYRFVELNKQPRRLNLKSSIQEGYFINYDDTLHKICNGYLPVDYYLPPIGIRQKIKLGFYYWERPTLGIFDIFGWGKWRLYGRDFIGYSQLSMPAYDKNTGNVILYLGAPGAGFLLIYDFDDGHLFYKTSITLWIS